MEKGKRNLTFLLNLQMERATLNTNMNEMKHDSETFNHVNKVIRSETSRDI